ncbi:MAG: hypothetical protein D6732_01795, partial [Methanobacteriota archaeon]
MKRVNLFLLFILLSFAIRLNGQNYPVSKQPIQILNANKRLGSPEGAVWAHTEMATDINPVNSANIVIGFNSTYPETYPTTATIGAQYSINGGTTWGSLNSLPGADNLGYASDPGCAFNTNGVVYISYVAYGTGYQDEARYNRSNDGGITWSNPVTVYTAAPGYGIDRPNIAIDNTVGSPYQNRRYFAWSRSQGGYLTNGIQFISPDLNNGVQTISNDIGWGVDMDTDLNGKLYVVWCDFNGNLRMNRSLDGGNSFIGTTTVVSGLINPVNIGDLDARYYPTIAIDKSDFHPNRVYIAYHSGPSNDVDIFLVYSDDG